MYNFVQWYDADTKANCAEGGANCVFKRFDAGGSSNWQDQRKDGKYGMLSSLQQLPGLPFLFRQNMHGYRWNLSNRSIR